MEALILTIPISILLALFFIYGFIWAARSGQFDKIEAQKNMIFDKNTKHKKGQNDEPSESDGNN